MLPPLSPLQQKNMSLIQKLENSYLGILRVVVIAAASLLLLVAVVMGVLSLKGMFPSAEKAIETTAVDTKEVLAQVTPDEPKKATDGDQKPAANVATKDVNIHQAEFDKIFAKTDAFVKKYSKNTEAIEKEDLNQYLIRKMSPYETEEFKTKYVVGLLSTIDASLQDIKVISRVEKVATTPAVAPAAQVVSTDTQNNDSTEGVPVAAPVAEKPFKESPIAIVQKIVDSYTSIFNRKISDAKEKQQEIALEQLQAKANSTMQMYVAAGLFGFFLLVVFLSIVIKIERNLREIANKEPEVRLLGQ